ncbi:MAG: Ig-like domain-containing protein [Clostridia bacterium]|nr:Ig-like domain-containing protein [Clostridia bacterium]
MKKLVLIITIFIIFLFAYTLPCYAFGWGEIAGDAGHFLSTGENVGGNLIPVSATRGMVEGLANILTTIGAVIILIGLLIIGLKYMMSTPEEAAKLKTKLIGLAIAGIIILGAYGIWKLTGSFFMSMTGESSSSSLSSGASSGGSSRGGSGGGGSPQNQTVSNNQVGQGNDEPKTNNPKPDTGKATIVDKNVTLTSGSDKQIQVKYENQTNTNIDNNITYTSDNPSIATVDNSGKITGVGSGQTIIRAKMRDGTETEISVTVNEKEKNIGGIYTSKFTIEDEGTYKGTTIDYWVYVPDIELVGTYQDIPLIVYLHGKYEGSSLEAVASNSLPKYISNENTLPNAIVVAPRYPEAAKNGWTMPSAEVVATVKHMLQEGNEKGFKIDTNRISITGYSLGAASALQTIRSYPGMFYRAVLVSPQDYPKTDIKCDTRIYFESSDSKKYRESWQAYYKNGQLPSNVSLEIPSKLSAHSQIPEIYLPSTSDSVEWLTGNIQKQDEPHSQPKLEGYYNGWTKIGGNECYVYIPHIDDVDTYENIPLIIAHHGWVDLDKMTDENVENMSIAKYLKNGTSSPNAIVIVIKGNDVNKETTKQIIENVKASKIDGINVPYSINTNKISITGFSYGARNAFDTLMLLKDENIFSAALILSNPYLKKEWQQMSYLGEPPCPIKFYWDIDTYQTGTNKEYGNKSMADAYAKKYPDLVQSYAVDSAKSHVQTLDKYIENNGELVNWLISQEKATANNQNI